MTIIQPKRTEADVLAVQAVINGVASKDQQMRAMDWIMREASRVQDNPFNGKEEPMSLTFAAGRQYVGQQIRAMLDPLAIQITKPRGTRT